MKRENRDPQPGTDAVWLNALAFAPDASSDHARTLLAEACQREDRDVIRAAVTNNRCPASALRRVTDRLLPLVAKDAEALEIMIAVAWNPSTGPRTMEKIAKSNHPDLKTVLCFNPATPIELLTQLAETANADMGYHIATHPSTPADLLDVLSGHPDTSVRDAVLANPRTPQRTLERLMGQIPDQVRLHAAARNPSMPPQALAEWATSTRSSVRRIVAANPSLPTHLMEQLAWTGDQRAQMAIASQPKLPENLARSLASNLTNTETRIALASNPGIPRHVALALLLDPAEEVRAAVIATHQSIPVQSLVHLVYEDSAPIVHAALARRSDIPTSPLIRLVDSSEMGEHSSAVSAARRRTTMETEVAFALHYHFDVSARMALYRRPDCPSEALEHAAQDPHPPVRASVAINPSASPNTIADLARDPDPVVSLLAQTSPLNPLTSR